MYLVLFCLFSLLLGITPNKPRNSGEVCSCERTFVLKSRKYNIKDEKLIVTKRTKCATTLSPEIQEKKLTLFERSNQLELQEREEGPQMTVMPSPMETLSETPIGRRFRSDYKYIPKVDGWLKLHSSHVNWFDALTQCQLEGTTLASPINNEMLEAMEEMVNQTLEAGCGVHTGIHATFSLGDFYTLDGIPLHNLKVPINMNKEHCSETLYDCMSLIESRLSYKRCGELQLPFMCFKKNVEVPPSLGKCSTVDPAYKLHGILNSCYKFHPEPRKWSGAFKTCSAEGAYLAIVNSDEEIEHLKNLFAAYPPTKLTSDYKDCVFLGYRIFGDETVTNHPLYFYTIHGQLLDQAGYNRWSKDQPNRSGNCGGMYRNGLLNDIWCHVPYPFICEKNPLSY